MKSRNKAKRVRFYVPIFDVFVTVYVTDNIPACCKTHFGIDIGDTRMACLGYKKNEFGIFLEPQAARRLEIVAHEIFHLTHRILERCAMNFDEGHHECGAYLNEWLTKQIFDILRNLWGGLKRK
jgi:hypothetical protein